MKEILGAPSVVLFCNVVADAGTDASATGASGTIDTRNAIGFGTGGGIIGNAKHVSILIPRNSVTTNKSVAYTLSHAASVTDAATNGTTLGTITQSANAATALLQRFEVDMRGLQPVLKVLAVPSSGGTAESVVCCAIATLFLQEQTPINSTMLASGGVVLIAGGVTQSNTAA